MIARRDLERPWRSVSFLVTEPAGLVFDGDLVRLPYRRPDGTVHAWRVVAPDGRCWWDETGLELLPFGLETLPARLGQRRRRALLVAEGESDALALREAFAAVGLGAPVEAYHVLGLPGAGTWRRAWWTTLACWGAIYVLGDGDAAGRRMIEAVCADVPWARPVWLPEGEDARSLLQREGPRTLDSLLDEADRVDRLCRAFLAAESYEDFLARLAPDPQRRAA